MDAFHCESKIATALAYGSPPPSAKQARVLCGAGELQKGAYRAVTGTTANLNKTVVFQAECLVEVREEAYEFSAG